MRYRLLCKYYLNYTIPTLIKRTKIYIKIKKFILKSKRINHVEVVIFNYNSMCVVVFKTIKIVRISFQLMIRKYAS